MGAIAEWSVLLIWGVSLVGVLLERVRVLLEGATCVVRAWRELRREMQPPAADSDRRMADP